MYCCYGCLSLGEQTQADLATPRTRPSTTLALKIGVGTLVITQSMILSLGINLEEDTPRTTKFAVHAAILGGTLIVFALFIGPLVRNAITEIRHRRLTTEWLFLLTMLGAFGASLQSFLTGHGPVYFEVVSVLLVVYSLGKALMASSRATAVASSAIWGGALQQGRVVLADGYADTPVAQIQRGTLVEVRPGETITVDGVVCSGTGFVSEAALRGEPYATVKRVGDHVFAGSVVHDATLRIETTVAGHERQVDQLFALVEQARQQPSSLQSMADRWALFFLPLIVATALTTFAVWGWLDSWGVGLFHAMSVLLVACPCALGLATPLVVWSAIGRLAERGIVVRTGDLVERLATITHVVFDKTGTLTDERFALVDIATISTGNDRANVLAMLARVQEQSQHPIAKPFADLPRKDFPHRVDTFQTVAGSGVEAVVGGQFVRIGRPEWIAAPDAEVAPLVEQLYAEGQRIDCTIDGRLVAIALVQEQLRPSASDTFDELRALGVGVEVLTGDSFERATQLGLPAPRGHLLPRDKAEHLRALQATGQRVLMVGDGINDAAALAVADVGLALSTGTDLANASASATLYHDDLRTIPWALALARQALHIVRRNLILAISYNIVGIALAAFGLLHPVMAALLMVASSVLVAWSATRVGVHVERDCHAVIPLDEQRWAKTFAHATALVLQSIILVSLFGLHGPTVWLVLIGGLLLGIVTAWGWQRWTSMPQGLDMAYTMLTFGNLGMIGGWWADAGFRPLQGIAHCDCATAMFNGVFKPGMWLGMFALGNLGMFYFTRHSHRHSVVSLILGNLGMGIGMLAGGWLAALIPTNNIPTAGWLSLTGMTLGMIVGMRIGEVVGRLSFVFDSSR